MNKEIIDEINSIDNVITANILKKDSLGRGLLSQNMLSQLRNLVEDVIVLYYNKKQKQNLSVSFQDKRTSYKFLESTCNPRFLNEFHKYLQVSKSHYTPNNNGAELLMQKYYYYLLKLKEYVKKEFDINILENILEYPLSNDSSMSNYYKKIVQEIESVKIGTSKFQKAKYYVENKKPIYINNKIYYEITLSTATDKINKFDRMIVYTKLDIMTNYAIVLSFEEKQIDIFSTEASIKIINNWRVAIRSCEINNLSKIFNNNDVVKSNMIEYRNLMKYLTNHDTNLLDLVLMSDVNYNKVKKNIGLAPTEYIFNLLGSCRKIVKNENSGSKVIRYLLYTMRNLNIKKQLNENIPLSYMSNLCLKSKCFPFEKMPFVLSLSNHIPSGEDLFMSQNCNDCEEQLFARYILNNIEQNGILYTQLDELTDFKNIDDLINKFNKKLYGNQNLLKIIKEHNYVYMEGYEKNTLDIINLINDLSEKYAEEYMDSYKLNEFIEQYQEDISEEKKEILKDLYIDSRVALIYGPAGTGKTTLISCFSDYLSGERKIYLANTNTAVENLKRKIKTKNADFYTIAEYNNNEYIVKECDLLVIDECSTVSNLDILDIIKQTNFKLLLLVGDVYQIESINFGNWFNFASQFVNKKVIYELSETFRTNNQTLLGLWKKVRSYDDKITEYIVNNRFSNELNNSIFQRQDDDEIILCLSYNGLYGINQINKYFQDFNKNEKYDFGIKSYKIGDPILFFDTKRFGKILYNNLKGKIVNIYQDENNIYFELEVDTIIESIDVFGSNIELIETKETSSIIKIFVEKEFENDEDDEDKNNIVPFNIAYALSIHKAQGLEYKSVKVVLTKEVENLITSNIFYTAITRAKEKLMIFWTSETGQYIVEQIKNSANKKDFYIFRNKYDL